MQAGIIQKLNKSGIMAGTHRPEVLRKMNWYAWDDLPDPDLSIGKCLAAFIKRFGVRPKVVVLDGLRHSVYQWHPVLPQPAELLPKKQLKGEGKPKKKIRR